MQPGNEPLLREIEAHHTAAPAISAKHDAARRRNTALSASLKASLLGASYTSGLRWPNALSSTAWLRRKSLGFNSQNKKAA